LQTGTALAQIFCFIPHIPPPQLATLGFHLVAHMLSPLIPLFA